MRRSAFSSRSSPTHIHTVKVASLSLAHSTSNRVVTDAPHGRKVGRFRVIDGTMKTTNAITVALMAGSALAWGAPIVVYAWASAVNSGFYGTGLLASLVVPSVLLRRGRETEAFGASAICFLLGAFFCWLGI